jgi:hypothetical protein
MMTPMRYHPVSPAGDSRTGFGFDDIMATADTGRFRTWYDAFSYIPPGRAGIEPLLSQPEAAEDDGSGIGWAA